MSFVGKTSKTTLAGLKECGPSYTLPFQVCSARAPPSLLLYTNNMCYIFKM